MNYDSYSVSTKWANGFPDCSTGTVNPGTETATATFDLNLPPISLTNIRLEVTLTPNITESTFIGEVLPVLGCTGTTVTSDYYLHDIQASHSDAQPLASHSYYVNVNTPVTYNLSGTSTFNDVVYNGTESTSLTASASQ